MSQMKAIIDKLLTNVSSALTPQGHISEMVFPFIESTQKTGKLGKYGQSHLRIENTIIGGEGKYRRVKSITRSTAAYDIEGHGLEGIVTKDDYRNTELPFDAEKDEAMGLSTKLWLEKEKSMSDILGDTAVITQNATLAGTSQFNDYASSDPIAKFKDARKAVRDGCGLPPNAAIMDWNVWNTLVYHPAILEALGYKHNRTGALSTDELAKAMGVQKLLVAEAVHNSGKEGQADSLAAVWSKNIIFAVVPEKAMPYQTSLGYYVKYSKSQPRKVYKYDGQNPPGSTVILVEDEYDLLISNEKAGYLLKNAIA